MTLIDFAVAMMIVVIVIFGSLFFVEWVYKNSDSYALEQFAKFGMPILLWAIMMLMLDTLQKSGIVSGGA